MKTHKLQAWLLIALTLLWSGPLYAQAVVATPLPNAKQTFLDANGNPLSSGKVFNYVPSTTTPKTTWSDTGETTPNTNPVTLDAAGRAQLWGQGSYRQLVKDSAGNTVWDAFTTAVGSATPTGGTGSDTAPVGTVVAYTGFIIPTNWALAYGQTFNRVNFPDLLTAITISEATMSCTSSSTTVSGLADTSQIPVGAPVESSCLPVGTTVASISTSTSLVVSQAATATGAFTARIFPWGNGDGSLTFNVPDTRGRALAGADAMGGTAANRLTTTYYGASAATPGVAGGSQSHTLTAAEAAALTYTTTATPNPPTITLKESDLPLAGGGTTRKYILDPSNFDGNPVTYSGTTEVLTTTSNAGGGAHAIVQPTLTANYIIKIKPNTTGAGGVTSLNGMFGDVVCDITMSCAPIGSVNTIGVNPAALSGLMDTAFSSTRGSILFRGATGWSALTPGTSGFVLATQGAGVDPLWVSNSNPSSNQNANTVSAGPTNGVPAPPTYRALVGADLPLPAASTLGGVKSSTAGANQFATGVDTSGNVTYAGLPAAGIIPLSQGGMGASQAGATANQIPVYPGSGGAASPTTLFSLLNVVCSTALTRPACITFMARADVTWFGAACDNSTNDIVAIQAAIDYMDATYTGGIVSIPAGHTCIINGPLGLKSGVVLWSPARFESAISVGASDVTAISATSTCQYCGIRNIFIVGTQSASAAHPTILVASGRPFLGVDSNIWGGSAALSTAGVDGLLFNVSLRAANTSGIGVQSTGANWYIRVILDNSVTGFAAFQQAARDAGLTGVMENSFTDCDFSGPYTHSVYIDDGGQASALTKFSGGSVFSQRVDIINAAATMFSTVEFGSTTLTNGAPLSIVGSYAFNPTTVTGAGGRSCSGNLGITC